MLQPGAEQPSPPTQLDYAKRPPLAWISRHRKLFIFLAICIAIGITVYRNRDSLKHRVLWIYWSRRAAAFVMPPRTELLILDPAEVNKLASNPDYVIFSGRPNLAIYSPLVYRQLARFDPRLKLGSTERTMEAVAFMGTLVRPDGKARVVIVLDDYGILTTSLVDGIGVLALPLPRWFDRVPPVPVGYPLRSWGFSESPKKIRLTSGFVDPANPSHIIFQYTIHFGGLPARGGYDIDDQIDARLGNDDSLSFTLHTTNWPDEERNTQLLQDATVKIPGDVQTLETEGAKFQQGKQRIRFTGTASEFGK